MRFSLIVIGFLFLFAACGGGGDQEREAGASSSTAADSELSEEQLEKGVGPVSDVSLGEIDQALFDQGAEIFKTKCSACHKMEERYVGPPLANILEQRTPEYVMNMILNPEEMLQKHPDAKAMLAEYLTPMPNQQLTRDDARAVLEYLRAEGSQDQDETQE